MTLANILAAVAGELALFAAVGFFVFALDDLLVDILYLTRRFWRSATVYRRHPRAFADRMAAPARPGWFAIFVPAWDESAVIGDMLRATLERFGDGDYRIFVGHYRNDEATALEILRVDDRASSRSRSTPTARPAKPIASIISMTRWSRMNGGSIAPPKPSSFTTPRTWSTRSNSPFSTDWSNEQRRSSSRSCR